MTLNPSTIDKLGKLFPRLASNHDGEVVATARAIIRTLETAGSSLHELSTAMTPQIVQNIVYRDKVVYRDRPAAPPAPAAPAKSMYEPVSDWKEIVRLGDIMLNECGLNARETSFVRQMRSTAHRMKSKFGMTAKQLDWWKTLLVDHDVWEATL